MGARRTLRLVREEIQAECIRTIERGAVDDSFHFSRRHRWKPLAVDVHGDDAIVLVATRGKRTGGGITAHHYRRRDGSWTSIGSGGGGGDDRTLPPRPTPGERWFRHMSSGMSVDSQTKGLFRSKRVNHLDLQVAAGVAQVEWRRRHRTAADHGFVCVVWRGRSMPKIKLFDSAGDRVDAVDRRDIQSPIRRMPWRARIRYAIFRRFHRGEWFNYAPRRR